jgi:uncharacterized protein YuzE
MKLNEGAIKNEKLLGSDVLLGYDKQGELVTAEVWDASKLLEHEVTVTL